MESYAITVSPCSAATPRVAGPPHFTAEFLDATVVYRQVSLALTGSPSARLHSLVPNSVNPGSSRPGALRRAGCAPLARRARTAFAAMTMATLTACASAGTPSPVAARGGVDSATAAALAREQASGSTTSSAIGIPPFELLSKTDVNATLGYAIADLLATDLSRSSKVTLVERSRLSEVVRELDLARSGRIDSATAPRAGKLMRANRLVLGSVDTLAGGEVRLGLRVADVETGALNAPLDVRAPVTDILSAEKALAFRLLEVLGVTLTPAERVAIEAHQTTSLEALSAYGRGVQAELLGDRRRAINEFERALVVDPNFGQARDRATDVRTRAARTGEAPSIVPGIRTIDGPVTGAVDRLNRPMDIITSLSRPLGGPGDPSFPSTIVTVVITVNRP